jgi:xanthine dehydrogenase accessory factor
MPTIGGGLGAGTFCPGGRTWDGVPLIAVKSGGDLGSGVVWRLHRCGFPVVILELPQPTVIRRMVAFASAVFEGTITVEGVTARLAVLPEVPAFLSQGVVPVVVDPAGKAVSELRPAVLVDAILAKRNTGTRMADAPLVVALGPGFCAGQDCHAVVETARGHTLGRVYWQGVALPNTGVPGGVGGVADERVVRAPAAGTLEPLAEIGDSVEAGQAVARVNGHAATARIGGVLRGLLYAGLPVTPGMKVGDVDPRGERAHCFTISDKALTVAGGVLEAVVAWLHGAPGTPGKD